MDTEMMSHVREESGELVATYSIAIVKFAWMSK